VAQILNAAASNGKVAIVLRLLQMGVSIDNRMSAAITAANKLDRGNDRYGSRSNFIIVNLIIAFTAIEGEESFKAMLLHRSEVLQNKHINKVLTDETRNLLVVTAGAMTLSECEEEIIDNFVLRRSNKITAEGGEREDEVDELSVLRKCFIEKYGIEAAETINFVVQYFALNPMKLKETTAFRPEDFVIQEGGIEEHAEDFVKIVTSNWLCNKIQESELWSIESIDFDSVLEESVKNDTTSTETTQEERSSTTASDSETVDLQEYAVKRGALEMPARETQPRKIQRVLEGNGLENSL
jgi:hypothetical protein